jgi:hypothetical protein
MKRTICTVALVGIVLCATGLMAQVQLTPQQEEAQRKIDDRLKNEPFNFYGKVLDENNQPVAGANVKILVQGELGSAHGSTEHDLQSGQDGLFKLEGVHSFGVIVTVSKDGYYTLPDGHGPWFWIIRNGTMPSMDHPAVFPLQKKGPTEPLIVMRTGSAVVATDGTPLEFNLERGHVVKDQPGTFNVQTWVDTHDPKSNQPYHWKFRITVPGGGLQLRTNEYQFIAPLSGYKEFDEVEITPGQPQWNDVRERNYFVKLADGKYAQVRLSVNARGSFGIADCFINPSGSQNLEFDPTKRLKPTP